MKVFILDTITPALAKQVITQVDQADGEDIEVMIFSTGGNVLAGNAIIQALRTYPGHVTTNVIGIAASMAAIISQVGDTRRIAPDATFNIHNSEMPITGRHTKESHQEAVETLSMLDALMEKSLSKSHLDAIGIQKLMEQDRLLSADEALSLGFFDEYSEPVAAVASLNQQINMTNLQSIMAKLNVSAIKLGLVRAELTEEEAARLAVLQSMESLTEEEAAELAALIEKDSAEPVANLTPEEEARKMELEGRETLTPEEEAELVALREKAAATVTENPQPTGAAILTADMVDRRVFNAFREEMLTAFGAVVEALKAMPDTEEMVALIEDKTTTKLDNVLKATKSATTIPTASQHFAQPTQPKTVDMNIINARVKEIKTKTGR